LPRIKLKSNKAAKGEKSNKILEEMVAKLDEEIANPGSSMILDQEMDKGPLGIVEEEEKEFSSDSEASECEEAAVYTPTDQVKVIKIILISGFKNST
jgi:hypothetical protein